MLQWMGTPTTGFWAARPQKQEVGTHLPMAARQRHAPVPSPPCAESRAPNARDNHCADSGTSAQLSVSTVATSVGLHARPTMRPSQFKANAPLVAMTFS